MRTLAINKRQIYYALYQGESYVYDADGNRTGEQSPSYGEPVAISMNVSASRGSASYDPFGINENYTKTLVTDDMSCPIKEDSILWVDVPLMDGETRNKHDYVVTQVARSLNHITYAIREVR